MNFQRATIESIAPSIDEAIEKGLDELGLSREEVVVEVLDEGGRGLFGLGVRQARVRLTVKEQSSAQLEILSDENSPIAEATPAIEQLEQPSAPSLPAEDDILRLSSRVVAELLDKMKIIAHVTSDYGEADDLSGTIPVMVEIHGDDLSILIGKRSETLNAIQYIARLIVSKEAGRQVTLVLDVEGYRTRRERQLRQLANRMADQAIRTGRRQVLEPMPPNERRIVHMELRGHPQVTTESYGEEPHRKVTIIPKEE